MSKFRNRGADVSTALTAEQKTAENSKKRGGSVVSPELFPHYWLVPKGGLSNLLWRTKILKASSGDVGLQRELRDMCRRDPLFWLNTFVWTFDSRLVERPKALPFNTFEIQDKAYNRMCQAWGRENMVYEKSRDTGASYIVLSKMLHEWQFSEFKTSSLVASYKADKVDLGDSGDTLFSKLVYMLECQPVWLQPPGWKKLRTYMKLAHPVTGSFIFGDSTNNDIARGDRYGVVFLDEYTRVETLAYFEQSIHPVTNCVIYVGTPQPQAMITAYHIRQKAAGGAFPLIQLWWWEDNRIGGVKQKGLYRWKENGPLVKFREKEHPEEYPKDYPYVQDGRLRSMWYDREFIKVGDTRIMDQEYDGVWHGSGGSFFKGIEVLKEETCWPPVRHSFDYDKVTAKGRYEAAVDPEGVLLLWRAPSELRGRKKYLSVDVSAGTGSSNSVLSGGCDGEKFLEVAVSDLRPDQFATLCAAIGWWLADGGEEPEMIVEQNGPGQIFLGRMKELGYRKLWRSENDKLGWHSDENSKYALFNEYQRELVERRYLTHSLEELTETNYYVWGSGTKKGMIEFLGNKAVDSSGARDNHGDRVVSSALLCKIMKQYVASSAPVAKKDHITDPYLWLRQTLGVPIDVDEEAPRFITV